MASWEKQGVSIWPSWGEHKIFSVLLGIGMVYGIIFLGARIQNTMLESRSVGFAPLPSPTISVSATGKVAVVPDLATVDITVKNTMESAELAQAESSRVMTAVILAMTELGIDSADLKTSSFRTTEVKNYDVSPPETVGYASVQTLTVRIRDENKISAVLDAGPENGATSVSSLRYDIDDDVEFIKAAREDAMAQARIQARDIVRAMGGRLGRVVNYSEGSSATPPVMYDMMVRAETSDVEKIDAPVEVGTEDVEVTVYVTFSVL